jgi:preprotein translocase subunit SecD
MIHFQTWKIILVVLACLLGIAYAAPNLVSEQTAATLPTWLPHKQVTLGLDLQGGSHLLLEVDTNAVLRERVNSLLDGVRATLRKDRNLRYTGIGIEGGQVGFRLLDADKVEQVRKDIRDSEPDAEVTVEGQQFRVGFKKAEIEAKRRSAIDQSIEIVRRRIDEMGTREPTIQRQGDDRILVQLPGVKEPERVKALLGKTAKLTFRFIDEETSLADAEQGRLPPSSEVLPSDDNARGGAGKHVVRKRVIVSGENLTNASASFDQNGQPVVSFKFDSVGAKRFGDATRENVGKLFAIVLDNRVISAPVIREPILGGSGQISGNFTTQSANDLALLLRAGALPAPLKVLEERTVGADLGADSIAAGTFASWLGLALVAIFMVVFYGFFGLIANIALLVNIVIIMAALSVLGATLTLPGIAGIVLTMGMAVDANVLIYERMREETRAGRSPISAIDAGFARAFGTIFDSNMTHLIAAAVLYAVGTGPVKGFAVTLVIGVATSLFTAVMVTRLIVVTWLKQFRPKVLPL